MLLEEKKVEGLPDQNNTTTPPAIKTPRYNGKADWEAYHAQSALLAHTGGWTAEQKDLHLAMCLTGDALTCLTLLSPGERGNNEALVVVLKWRL